MGDLTQQFNESAFGFIKEYATFALLKRLAALVDQVSAPNLVTRYSAVFGLFEVSLSVFRFLSLLGNHPSEDKS